MVDKSCELLVRRTGELELSFARALMGLRSDMCAFRNLRPTMAGTFLRGP